MAESGIAAIAVGVNLWAADPDAPKMKFQIYNIFLRLPHQRFRFNQFTFDGEFHFARNFSSSIFSNATIISFIVGIHVNA